MAYDFFESPIGLLRIGTDQRKIRTICLVTEREEERPNPVTRMATEQLQEYFSKKRQQFTMAAMPAGTPFQLQVWGAVSQIPYGKVATYGQIAAAIGQPTACRAVANAIGQNPMLIFVPCHRVVAANGLGGFSAGLEAKRSLLTLEGVEFGENAPISEKFLFTFEGNCDTI